MMHGDYGITIFNRLGFVVFEVPSDGFKKYAFTVFSMVCYIRWGHVIQIDLPARLIDDHIRFALREFYVCVPPLTRLQIIAYGIFSAYQFMRINYSIMHQVIMQVFRHTF